ncbi:MAG: ferritin [Spirochaetales bacterium]|nr:ferritin [Spirochaetales bacterium]
MEDALNKQINEEMFSAYLYLAMSADFEEKGLAGFANWMRVQAQEENDHAMKIFDFITRRNGIVKLEAIAKPEQSWDSPMAAIEAAYNHEIHITGCINALVKTARELNDNATENELQWFVNEQVEEEENASKIMDKLKTIGESGHGMLMIDNELSQRAYTPINPVV